MPKRKPSRRYSLILSREAHDRLQAVADANDGMITVEVRRIIRRELPRYTPGLKEAPVRITGLMPLEMYEILYSIAEGEDTSVSDVMRRLIESGLSRSEE